MLWNVIVGITVRAQRSLAKQLLPLILRPYHYGKHHQCNLCRLLVSSRTRRWTHRLHLGVFQSNTIIEMTLLDELSMSLFGSNSQRYIRHPHDVHKRALGPFCLGSSKKWQSLRENSLFLNLVQNFCLSQGHIFPLCPLLMQLLARNFHGSGVASISPLIFFILFSEDYIH